MLVIVDGREHLVISQITIVIMTVLVMVFAIYIPGNVLANILSMVMIVLLPNVPITVPVMDSVISL